MDARTTLQVSGCLRLHAVNVLRRRPGGLMRSSSGRGTTAQNKGNRNLSGSYEDSAGFI